MRQSPTMENGNANDEVTGNDNSGLELETQSDANPVANDVNKGKLENETEVKDYSRILAEYEHTLSSYVQNMEELKSKLEDSNQEKLVLTRERDQAMEDLSNVESAFSDLHRKYERTKSTLTNFKENEDQLIARERELTKKIEIRDQKLNMYREQAESKLESMYQDYENKLKDYESEITRLRAQCRLAEMKLSTLENDVEQKAKENAQLNALCNELINGQTN